MDAEVIANHSYLQVCCVKNSQGLHFVDPASFAVVSGSLTEKKEQSGQGA
jgi:hypothetical protein